MRKKILCGLLWLCVAAWAVFIFHMSAMVASESARTSGGVLEWLSKFLGQWLTDFLVRKCAHAFEYGVLCGLLCAAFHFTFSGVRIVYAVLTSVLYAVSDEIHQLFVPGRACRVFDVFVDSCGVITMAAVVLLIVFIVNKHFSKEDFV